MSKVRARGRPESVARYEMRHRVVVADLREAVGVPDAGGGAEGPQGRRRTRQELEIVRHLDDRAIRRSRGRFLGPQRLLGPGERPSAADEEHRDDGGDQEEDGGKDPRQEVEDGGGRQRCGAEGTPLLQEEGMVVAANR